LACRWVRWPVWRCGWPVRSGGSRGWHRRQATRRERGGVVLGGRASAGRRAPRSSSDCSSRLVSWSPGCRVRTCWPSAPCWRAGLPGGVGRAALVRRVGPAPLQRPGMPRGLDWPSPRAWRSSVRPSGGLAEGRGSGWWHRVGLGGGGGPAGGGWRPGGILAERLEKPADRAGPTVHDRTWFHPTRRSPSAQRRCQRRPCQLARTTPT
jgi:hypothetical protein